LAVTVSRERRCPFMRSALMWMPSSCRSPSIKDVLASGEHLSWSTGSKTSSEESSVPVQLKPLLSGAWLVGDHLVLGGGGCNFADLAQVSISVWHEYKHVCTSMRLCCVCMLMHFLVQIKAGNDPGEQMGSTEPGTSSSRFNRTGPQAGANSVTLPAASASATETAGKCSQQKVGTGNAPSNSTGMRSASVASALWDMLCTSLMWVVPIISTGKKRRFFQLSCDLTTLRWSW
jgi:hypothetical protein